MCPYLRLESDGVLLGPEAAPRDDHRCVAIDGPRVISHQQQELVCLRTAHLDCPRYRRAGGVPSSRGGHGTPAVPRAIAVSLAVLAVSAGVSFGFVVQRGGIDLPPSARSSAAAVVASARPSPVVTPAATGPAGTSTPAPTPEVIDPSSLAPATERPSQPSSAAPSASSEPTTAPSSSVAPSASTGPSASRLAVLKPCTGQTGCYVYTIRSGDNLFSIAHWFGVPLATVNRMNPTLRATGIHAGMQIKIPTPTR